jgi:pimeloyl-ACP methyl ester carboxylesterase
MRILKTILLALAATVIAAVSVAYLAPASTWRLLVKLQRAGARLERKDIQLPDGLHYAYLEGGKGEPLLLLHGFGGNKDEFNAVAGHLTARYRVIVPDHIGFGESAHPVDADYSPPAQAKRLQSLAHALGCDSLHLAGNSMGGHIAMTYAALYPNEAKSLWLLDPSGVWSAPSGIAQTTISATGEHPLLIRKPEDLATIFEVSLSSPPYVPRPLLNVLAAPRIENYALERRILKELLSDSVEQRVAGLATPALIVWGSEDRIISVEASSTLNRLMPLSQVIVMQHTGHLPAFEKPEQSVRDYLRFRESLGQREPTPAGT